MAIAEVEGEGKEESEKERKVEQYRQSGLN